MENVSQSSTKIYPIYSFNARWSQIGVQDPKYPVWYEGLPEGRIWNGTGFTKMYKEELTQEQLDVTIKEWWEKYLTIQTDFAGREKTSLSELDVQDLTLEAKYKEHNSFVCTWFGHETFDIGQTDEEFLKAFEEFVQKYEHQDRKDPDYHCLMGAEDRWRWRSGDDKYESIPCRCESCKSAGMLRIAH